MIVIQPGCPEVEIHRSIQLELVVMGSIYLVWWRMLLWSVMSDARPGLVLDIVKIGEVPLVEVNILVLSGYEAAQRRPLLAKEK